MKPGAANEALSLRWRLTASLLKPPTSSQVLFCCPRRQDPLSRSDSHFPHRRSTSSSSSRSSHCQHRNSGLSTARVCTAASAVTASAVTSSAAAAGAQAVPAALLLPIPPLDPVHYLLQQLPQIFSSLQGIGAVGAACRLLGRGLELPQSAYLLLAFFAAFVLGVIGAFLFVIVPTWHAVSSASKGLRDAAGAVGVPGLLELEGETLRAAGYDLPPKRDSTNRLSPWSRGGRQHLREEKDFAFLGEDLAVLEDEGYAPPKRQGWTERTQQRSAFHRASQDRVRSRRAEAGSQSKHNAVSLSASSTQDVPGRPGTGSTSRASGRAALLGSSVFSGREHHEILPVEAVHSPRDIASAAAELSQRRRKHGMSSGELEGARRSIIGWSAAAVRGVRGFFSLLTVGWRWGRVARSFLARGYATTYQQPGRQGK